MDIQTQSLRQPLNQSPPVPKLFKPLVRTTGEISVAPKNCPIGILNLHPTTSLNVKVPLSDTVENPSTTNPVKRLTTFRLYQRQKRASSSSRSFTSEVKNILKSIKDMINGLILVFLAGIKLLALLIFRAFHEILKGMFKPVLFLMSKIMPLYPEKWLLLINWIKLKANIDIYFDSSLRIAPKVDASMRKQLTLVLDLDETLIHSSKVKPVEGKFEALEILKSDGTKHLVYIRRRPHLEQFLEKVSKEFKVVIFTASRMEYADAIIDLIDTKDVITYRLYRDSCSRGCNGWVKDLSKIEPNLNRVILLDNCRAASTLQPENHLLIKSWFYDETDDHLLHYTNFLLDCAKKWRTNMLKIRDLRRCLKEFVTAN